MNADPALPDDISGLAWTQEALRKSLETAHRSLCRLQKEAASASDSEFAATTVAPLRAARRLLHEGAGVLDLVGLPAAATLLRGSEALVQRHIAKPGRLDARLVDAIHDASLAVLDVMARRIAGQPVSPLTLFPPYLAIQTLATAERIHPADLWSHEWQWPALPPEPGLSPRTADPLTTADVEAQVLALMRGPGPAAAQRLSDLSAALAAGVGHPRAAALWQLAAGFFEAQALGLLAPDIHTKRSASRLLGQLRLQQRQPGSDCPASVELLARDLSFFCVHAKAPDPDRAPRLSAVRQATPAASGVLGIGEPGSPLGRHDPAAVLQARKRLEAARDGWSAVAGGEWTPAAGLVEQFSLVADSLGRLAPEGQVLGALLLRLAAAVVRSGLPPAPPLAMEVATGLLCLDAALQEDAGLPTRLADPLQRLAQRILAVEQGGAVEPIEAWMVQTCRRVSDRQAWGSVARELHLALSQAEARIDDFFRTPRDPAVLAPVPGQLRILGGVLSVLDLPLAEQAVQSLLEDLEALRAEAATGEPGPEAVERVTTQLGALSLLVDRLGVQPHTAEAMFRRDPDTGLLHSLLERQGPRENPPASGGPAPSVSPRLDVGFDVGDAPQEQVKMIGPLAVAIPVFNAYLNAADELSRRLITELSEWALELQHPLGGVATELTQSLGDGAAAVGLTDLSALAHRLGRALERVQAFGRGSVQEAALFMDVANEIRRLLHQFAAGFLKSPQASLLGRFQAQELEMQGRLPEPVVMPDEPAAAPDAVDPALFAFFEDEAQGLMPELLAQLRRWAEAPDQPPHADACLRVLHTLKGGARLAGALGLGERIHCLEADIGRARQAGPRGADPGQALLWQADDLSAAFDQLRGPRPRLAAAAQAPAHQAPQLIPTVRVGTALLDRLTDQAGEMNLSRERLSSELGHCRVALSDLSGSLEHLQQQCRELETLADGQIGAPLAGAPADPAEAARTAHGALPGEVALPGVPQAVDPLAVDRSARLQALAADMADSIKGLVAVQCLLQQALDSAEDQVTAQARLGRGLQDGLQSSRRAAFEGLVEHFHQVVRQTARETGKSVRLALLGGSTEVDRGLIERLSGGFDHLLRNAVVHGIEPAGQRAAAGKGGTGLIEVSLWEEDRELCIEFRDDGAGLDLPRISARAAAMGLIDPALPQDDAGLAELIYRPGLSTAEAVSALAGRGVGLDVLRQEVQALGGRIETRSVPGQGACFTLMLPIAAETGHEKTPGGRAFS
jgi:signal transduction histidine kinase